MKNSPYTLKKGFKWILVSARRMIWAKVESLYLLFQQHWLEIAIIITFVGIMQTQQPQFTVSFSPLTMGQEEEVPKAMNTSLMDMIHKTINEPAIKPEEKVTPNSVMVKDAKRLKQEAYIEQYAAIAKREMEEFGVPASITLAQGLLESNIGQSSLATKNYNHFGIKCFSRKCKKGHCSNHEDDSHKDFFLIFEDAEASYRAHSKFLHKKRYQHLFNLDRSDYKGWAHGLKKAGYATDPRYAYKLIALIETLGLYEYDDDE